MYRKQAIEGYPLQTYASALLFSPRGGLIRRLFQHEEPEEITIRPATGDSWSACLQTLEGHSNWVSSVAFSHDSTWLASASYDSTVKIWDARSAACLQTLEGHSREVSSVTFSHNSTRLASVSHSSAVKIWDTSSGVCLQTLEGHSYWVSLADLIYIHTPPSFDEIVTKPQQSVSQGIAIRFNDTWISVMLKICCGSQRSIDQYAQLCQADVLA
jgi:WD40 repeat protein